MLTASGIRMVMMNTNIYYTSNDALNLTTDVDPTGQLNWLESVLASAVTNGEKVGYQYFLYPGSFKIMHRCF